MSSLPDAVQMTTDQNSQWALLWSQSQSAMHIEPVEVMLKKNRHFYVADRRNDYLPLVFGSRELCQQVADKVRQTLHARQKAALERNQCYGASPA